MSVTATNYISSSDLEIWMEQKTEDLYGNLRGAMDVSTNRGDAEEALNKIKAELADAEKNGTDPTAIRDEAQDALNKYQDEFPTIAQPLQSILDALNPRIAAVAAGPVTPSPQTYLDQRDNTQTSQPAAVAPPAAKVEKGESDAWGKAIGDVVDDLGKDDQLGMINIQEFNSQINQTKQIASALLDSADKAADAIISHIS